MDVRSSDGRALVRRPSPRPRAPISPSEGPRASAEGAAPSSRGRRGRRGRHLPPSRHDDAVVNRRAVGRAARVFFFHPNLVESHSVGSNKGGALSAISDALDKASAVLKDSFPHVLNKVSTEPFKCELLHVKVFPASFWGRAADSRTTRS